MAAQTVPHDYSDLIAVLLKIADDRGEVFPGG
jgi:hypothetical protein